jgi:hypothetical protein
LSNGSSLRREPGPAAAFGAPIGSARPASFGGLRAAAWLTRRRLLLWGLAFALMSGMFLVTHVVQHTALGIASSAGEPIGDDFINFYSGARVAAGGQAAMAYDHRRFHAFQESVTGVPTGKSRDPWIEVRIYSYPPTALLLTMPLGLLPFVPALIAWTAFGLVLCWVLLRRLVGWQAASVSVIGVPAAFFNLQSGQNGFFTAALLGGGLMALPRRPLVAGVCFGCLVYKPQLGVLLPFALAAAGYWRAIAAAAVTAGVLAAASYALFGPEAWSAFAGQMTVGRHLLEFDKTLWDRMLSVFAAMRQLHAPPATAYVAQLLSGVVAVAAAIWVWRSQAHFELKAAGLIVATFLATPYVMDYDAVLLIFAAAWLWREGVRTGFLPWEELAIAALLVVTLPMVLLNRLADLPIAPPVLWLVLLVLIRRSSRAVGDR